MIIIQFSDSSAHLLAYHGHDPELTQKAISATQGHEYPNAADNMHSGRTTLKQYKCSPDKYLLFMVTTWSSMLDKLRKQHLIIMLHVGKDR